MGTEAQEEAARKAREAKARKSLRKGGGRKSGRQSVGQRRVKMLRPVCNAAKMAALGLDEGKACQDSANITPQWWESCTHDPYFSLAARGENRPVFTEPDDQGKMRVERYEDEVWYEEHPNLVQVSLGVRHNNGSGVERARRKGFILPEEHPTKAIAPYCQFIDCWSQEIKIRSTYGDYCEEWQAKLAAADALGKTLEIGADNLPGSMEKRQEQLAGVSV